MSFQGGRRPPMNFGFSPRGPPPRPGGPMMGGPPLHMRGPRPSLPQSQNKNRTMPQDDQDKPKPEKPPVTTVFVGSIADRAPDKLIRTLLQRCGNIVNWKRVQGADGKMQGFGFCEFEIPESTLRCVRLLNDWPIADKKLVVKVDDKTRKLLDDYEESHKQDDEDMKREDRLALAALDAVMKEFSNDLRRHDNRRNDHHRQHNLEPMPFRPPIASGPKADEGLDDMEVDDDAKDLINREINRFRLAYKNDEVVTEIKTTHRPADKKDTNDREKTTTNERDDSKESDDKKDDTEEKREETKPKEKEEQRRRDRSRSRELERKRAREERDREKERERRPERERQERSERERQERSERERLDRSERERPDRSERERPDRSVRTERERPERTRDRSARRETKETSRDKERADRVRPDRKVREAEREADEDPDEKYERLRAERQLRDKEMAYQERLKNWEVRERKKIREFERERTRSEERKIEEKKEARRLREFLEDYNDDKDDVKYYKGSGLLRRQKEREKEAEADARDRQKEKEELEVLRQKLIDEGHPDPDGEIHRQQNGRPQREPSPEPEVISTRDAYNPEDESVQYNSHSPYPSNSNTHSERFRPVSDEDSQTGHTFPIGKRKKLTVKEVFNNDDEGDDNGPKKRMLKSIDEETKKSAAEQKKLAIKRLIERIPTEKDELFKWPIDWSVLDQNLLKTRVQPWVNKKIADYIGEEEKTLTDFICQKVMSRSNAQAILTDVAMVLDDEAEVFVVKMWRLLVYETEAKKAGLMAAR